MFVTNYVWSDCIRIFYARLESMLLQADIQTNVRSEILPAAFE